ncbi:MAG: hypothetical protein IT447_08690 [Phycisphaerales bacterium]|jgi:hypothetical protein|nr:hypothetical protein [Phycisphaerales bacterium]
MRQLRQTVERGREAYQTVRYPDDLAAQVLGGRRSWRWVLPMGGLAAAAAAVVITLWPQRPVSTPRPSQPIATVTTPAHQTPDSLLAMPSMPQLPDGIDLMPKYQALSPRLGAMNFPSYPGFPSRDFESVQSTSTTREAV